MGAPSGPIDLYLRSLSAVVRAEMVRRARLSYETDGEWERVRGGFHAHVLVWERESLIVPVAAELNICAPALVAPPDVRSPAAWLAGIYKSRPGENYDKATEGNRLLKQIARQPELRERVLAANESVRGIVAEIIGC